MKKRCCSKIQRNYLSGLVRVYRQADKIVGKNKNCDRETIVQTLLLLKKPAIERLKLALLRSGKLHVY